MEHVLIKVYGTISPSSDALFSAMKEVAEDAVEQHKTFISIEFEGMFFMIDDLIDAIKPHLTAEADGKIDYIDMDEWTLTRFFIKGGMISHNTASLNHVMDHSGH